MSRSMTKIGKTLRSRGFSFGLHAVLWLLLLLVVLGLGGYAPPFRETRENPSLVTTPVPVAKLQKLFAAINQAELAGNPDASNLFETSYFIPPPPSSPPPAAPPPTSWKVELTYQGFYRTGDGPKYAVLRLGDKLVSVPEGGCVLTNLFVQEATVHTLTLTNTAIQTNTLALNVKQIVEVPFK